MDRSTKRKRSEKADGRVALIAITVVVASLAAFVGIRMSALKQKEQLYHEQELALLAQVAEQEERAEKLQEYRVYVQTKEFIEKEAKEKLGLVNPDEIILVPNE